MNLFFRSNLRVAQIGQIFMTYDNPQTLKSSSLQIFAMTIEQLKNVKDRLGVLGRYL